VRRELDSQLQRLGLRSPFPWDTLAEAEGVLKSSASGAGSHGIRRDRVNELADRLRTQLQRRLDDDAAGDVKSALAEFGPSATGVLKDASAIRQELARIERSIEVDPGQAIGRAKNLVESTAKAVLDARGVAFTAHDKTPALATRAMEALDVAPKQVIGTGTEAARRLASRLAASPRTLRSCATRWATVTGR